MHISENCKILYSSYFSFHHYYSTIVTTLPIRTINTVNVSCGYYDYPWLP
jgi:hypothetical protein